jgi:hypothetical protein
MNELAITVAAGGLLIAVVMFLVVPVSVVRGAALSLSFFVLAIFGHNGLPREIWIPVSAFVLIVLVIAVARSGGVSKSSNPMFIVLCGWWGFVAMGVLINGSYSPQATAGFILTVLAMVFVATRLNRQELKVVLLGFLLVGGFEVAWALAELITNATPLWGYRGDLIRENPLFAGAVPRAQGTMAQPIVYGTLMGVVVLIAWSNAIIQLGPRLRILALGVGLAGVVLSGTRSVILAVVIAIALHILLRKSLGRWLRNILLAGAITTVVAVVGFGIGDKINDLMTSGSWLHRLGSLQAVPALLARPEGQAFWGTGWGSQEALFDKGYIPLTYGLKVVDNYFVYVLGTSGIVGVVLLLAMCAFAFFRAAHQGKMLVTFCVCIFFSFDIGSPWLYGMCLLSVCLCLPGKELDLASLPESAFTDSDSRPLDAARP